MIRSRAIGCRDGHNDCQRISVFKVEVTGDDAIQRFADEGTGLLYTIR